MPRSSQFDWAQFQLGIFVKARPEELYALWTTGHGLGRWFLRTAEFAPATGPAPRGKRAKLSPFPEGHVRAEEEACRAGDLYRWEWYYDGGITGEGRVTQMRPPTRFGVTFGNEMEVEIGIRKQGPWCELSLRQFKIPDTPQGRWSLHMGCRVGWTFFLTNLKSVAEGGPDLRETDRMRTKQLHLINI